MEIPDARIQELLGVWPVARLATLAADGTPRLVPIVFVLAAGELWSPIDGKPKGASELARVRHVRRDPRVGVLLDAYGPDWSQLWWIALEASARSAPLAEAGPGAAAVADSLREKYPQYASVPLFSGSPRFLIFRIERVRSWCAGPAALESPASCASSGDTMS